MDQIIRLQYELDKLNFFGLKCDNISIQNMSSLAYKQLWNSILSDTLLSCHLQPAAEKERTDMLVA